MTQKTDLVSNRPWWDYWIAIYILAAISLVAGRLWITEWTGDLYLLVYSTFLAGVAGLALGYSHFSPLIAAIFSAVYGTFTIGWLFGATLDMELTWYDRLVNILGFRLQIGIQQFAAGKTVIDPLLFLIIMALMLWVIASTAAFILIRRGAVWAAVLPLGLTLLIVSQYDPDQRLNTRFLIFFLFFALMLVGRMTFLENREKWRREGINPTSESQMDLGKTLLMLVTILLIITWLFPLTPPQVNRYSELWDTLTQPWDRVNESVSKIFVADNPSTTLSASYFGDTLQLGTGSPIDEKVVLIVRPDSGELAGYRNYWRARSYDRYLDINWTSSPGFTEEFFFPDSGLPTAEWENSRMATFTFTNATTRMINIYTTGAPVHISRPVQVTFQTITDGEIDLKALIADPNLSREESYQITTQLYVPTAAELRRAPEVYPDWLDRYLQLPSDFSPKIRNLAEEIIANADTAYDKTAAITQYLRETIEYSRSLPPIPPDVDPLEWFLFDEQIGFCNYYATAQILMLRSLGIPARLAVGYAEGEYDPEAGQYIVRKQDSHAWPEVYFVGVGWVTFEPTVSQRALALPSGETVIDDTPSLPAGEGGSFDSALTDPAVQMPEGILSDTEAEALRETSPASPPVIRISSATIPLVILGVTLFALVAGILIIFKPDWFKINLDPLPVALEGVLNKNNQPVPQWLIQWSRRASLSIPAKAYRQLGRSMGMLGQTPEPPQTPQERADILTGLLPEAKQQIQEILDEYHFDQFSDHLVNEDRARNATRQVRLMAYQARLRRVFSWDKKSD